MPTTLSDRDAELAFEAVDWYVKEGLPDERVRAVALGEEPGTELKALADLRIRLRAMAAKKVVIGRHAFDYLRAVPWDDVEVTSVLDGARNTKTRVTVHVPKEVCALFGQVLRDHADEALEAGDRVTANRMVAGSRAFGIGTNGNGNGNGTVTA